MEQEEREPVATKDETGHAGGAGGGGGRATGISSLPRKRKYRYLSGMYALVLRVTSAPFKHHQWLRELPLPLTVLAVRVRVGSREWSARRNGNEMERVTEALEKGRRGRGGGRGE